MNNDLKDLSKKELRVLRSNLFVHKVARQAEIGVYSSYPLHRNVDVLVKLRDEVNETVKRLREIDALLTKKRYEFNREKFEELYLSALPEGSVVYDERSGQYRRCEELGKPGAKPHQLKLIRQRWHTWKEAVRANK